MNHLYFYKLQHYNLLGIADISVTASLINIFVSDPIYCIYVSIDLSFPRDRAKTIKALIDSKATPKIFKT